MRNESSASSVVMLNFTVDPLLERAFQWYLHAVGCVVLPLNLVTFYVIYAKASKHNRTYRYYVLHMQFWSTLSDLHFGLLFMPLSLFPLAGGYCNGLLCRAGLPMHYSLAIMYLLLFGIFHSLGISIFYRHQLILPAGHWMRIRKAGLACLFFLFSLSTQMPTITFALGAPDKAAATQHLRENHPAMMWLTEKDNWVVYDPRNFPVSWMKIELIVMAFCPTLYVGIAVHLFRGISRASFMSLKTRNLHKRIVRVLIAQVCLVHVFLVAPTLVFVISVFTERISHETNMACFALLMVYSWTHSLVLIATTPSYRKFVAELFSISRTKANPLLRSEES